jgi:RluA family pseudouridine synthase
LDLPEIIYEDEHLLAINKPAGLLTIRDGYNPSLAFIATLLEPHFGRVWVVHRLDRDTSGILLLARTRTAHRDLNSQFENREIKKTYHAIISGCPPWENHRIDLSLKVDGDRKHRTIVSVKDGKPASTDCHLLERFAGDLTLLAANPLTGYTHQIRAHLASIGYPILGDRLYSSNLPGRASLPSVISRLALHAQSIQFHHPHTRLPIAFEAKYPLDFASAVETFRNISNPVS